MEAHLEVGQHGTGKTHAAIVLGVETCRRGYRVLFTTAADLGNTLVEAREEKRLKNYLSRLQNYHLIIVTSLVTSRFLLKELNFFSRYLPIVMNADRYS